MKSTIRPLGILKEYIGDQHSIQVEPGKTVSTVLKDLGIPSELVAGVFLNDKMISKDYCIGEEDVITLIAIIGGG